MYASGRTEMLLDGMRAEGVGGEIFFRGQQMQSVPGCNHSNDPLREQIEHWRIRQARMNYHQNYQSWLWIHAADITSKIHI
jgi:hypothetical protein